MGVPPGRVDARRDGPLARHSEVLERVPMHRDPLSISGTSWLLHSVARDALSKRTCETSGRIPRRDYSRSPITLTQRERLSLSLEREVPACVPPGGQAESVPQCNRPNGTRRFASLLLRPDPSGLSASVQHDGGHGLLYT